MKYSSRTLYNWVRSFVGWAPFLIFSFVIVYLLANDFKNDVDEYFVRIILKSCFVLIAACSLSQFFTFFILNGWKWTALARPLSLFKELFDFVCAFPVVEVGIFSIGIFFSSPALIGWIWVIALLMTLDTLQYWMRFSESPIRNLYAFARFHQMDWLRTQKVLGPYFVSAFINYFFVTLKKFLLPLVFILVVMDFRIILPRLVEAGLTYQAFALLMSLMVSLHLLSYREDFS